MSMSFRVIFACVTVVGAVLGWVLANGRGLTLGYVKDDLVKAYEEAGVDVSQCKKPRTILDPSGGMNECLQGVFKDIQHQVDEVDKTSQEIEADLEHQEEPPVDMPSYDPPADE